MPRDFRFAALLPAVAFALAPFASAVAGDPSPERARRDLEAGPTVDVARRIEAASILATLPEGVDRDRALPVVLAALESPSADLRAAVAGTCARWRDRRALGPLVARLAHEADESTAAALLLAVGAVGAPDDAASVEGLAGSPSTRVRSALATCLGDLGGPRSRARLLQLLAKPGDDRDWAVRGAVLLALARCGTRDDAGVVLVAYREGDGAQHWFARATLASAIAALDSDPIPILDRLCADDDDRVSSAAALAFVRAGRPQEVVRRLSDARPGVRAAAATAIASALPAESARLIPLATGDPDRGVRWSAALALSRLDDPASDTLLAEGVASDDPQVWATALGECRRKTGLSIGRDGPAWEKALADRRRNLRGSSR
jgi:HEAT repeat protein